MEIQIDLDAARVLSALAQTPRDQYVAATEISKLTQLTPDRLNDAATILVDLGHIDWLQVMGTTPYDFSEAMITPRGRREYQRNAPSSNEATPQVKQGQSAHQQSVKLFISHASEDAELARRLIALVSRALVLPGESIRCTSVDGYRLPAGANTSEQLRIEVHDATAFVGIVSHASVRSMYVLFELGARWGAGKPLIPLVAHGVPMSVMDGPLSGLNALRADTGAQLQQLIHDLGTQLSIMPQSPAVFDHALGEVLQTPKVGSEAQAAMPSPEVFSREEEQVLLSLAETDGQSPEQLVESLGLGRVKVDYLLDRLQEGECVCIISYGGGGSRCFLEKNGRKYLFERALLT